MDHHRAPTRPPVACSPRCLVLQPCSQYRACIPLIFSTSLQCLTLNRLSALYKCVELAFDNTTACARRGIVGRLWMDSISLGGAMLVFRTIALVVLVVMITAVGSAQTSAVQNNAQQRLQDKLDIQDLIVRYGTALDTLDADAYAGVFTADAELDVAGNVRKGRQQIREIVTGLQRTRDENKAKGTPSPALKHVISNTSIEILKNDEARHRSYWQTVRVGLNNQVTVGAIGQYEDVIVK